MNVTFVKIKSLTCSVLSFNEVSIIKLFIWCLQPIYFDNVLNSACT